MEDLHLWLLGPFYGMFAFILGLHVVFGFRRYGALEASIRLWRSRQQKGALMTGFIMFVTFGLTFRDYGNQPLMLHLMVLLIALTVYAAGLYPYIVAPQMRRYHIKRWLSQLPESLRSVKIELPEWRLLHRIAKEQPKSFVPTAQVLLQFQTDKPGLREAFPSLNRAYLYRLPNYLGLFCANCMHYTQLKQFKCARCGANDMYIGVEQFGIGYAPQNEAHYWADRRAGIITLNLANDIAWQYTHLDVSHAALDFSRIPNPDYLLNRVLTTWPQLTREGSEASFELAGTELLEENTQRMLSHLNLLPPRPLS